MKDAESLAGMPPAPRPQPFAQPFAGWHRLLLRAPAAAAITLWAWLLLRWGALIYGRVRRDTRSLSNLQSGCFIAWSQRLLRILGVRVHLRGSPPQGATVLVANHVSYLDIPLVAAHWACTFVAKAEIASWPIAGRVCRDADTLFIDRSRKRDLPRALAEIQRVVALGRGVVIFPEGTSGSGDELLAFRSSLLELPASAGLDVYWAALRYRAPAHWPAARVSIAWWGAMPLLPHLLLLLRLPRIDADLSFGGPVAGASGVDRKALADVLRGRIQEQLENPAL